MLQHTVGQNGNDNKTQDEYRADDGFVELIDFHQLMRCIDKSMLEAQRPKEWSHKYQGKCSGDSSIPRTWHIFDDERAEEETNQNHCDDNGQIDNDVFELSRNKVTHTDLLAAPHLDAWIVVFQSIKPAFREMTRHPIVARHCCLDGVRRDKSRDNRHRDDDGVKEVVDDTEAET